ncbi:MAG: CAP domain-containing protein [Pirellulaceae bacterium]|jgi:uncharacterized protein YkwD|nr:CAP domain-containing protein [Pirellulaceae bacterium]
MNAWSLIALSVLAFGPDEDAAIASKAVPLHEHPTLMRMLEENNRLRASVGRPAQQMSRELTRAAQDHAWYMARTGNFSHESNGGPVGRAMKHGFGGFSGENIAMGQPTVRSAFQSWRSSSGHWANIISGARLAGFGYAIAPDGSTYWVAMYGN